MSDKKSVTEKVRTIDHLASKMIRPTPQPKSPPSKSSGGESKK
ncbi:hypothetical protein ArsFIN_28130 [Arsenophonus nasoniae]|uniref:Uncharacterized protein n=1 Tax=Arsenophonus nasoniae TaxID=638 RepID=A0A4P7KWA1_9GAMM|nr:hypothetical protein ArsFIN_28130 [Arsenophonus nasoniae]